MTKNTLRCHLYAETKTGTRGTYQVLHPMPLEGERMITLKDKHNEERYYDACIDQQALTIYNFGTEVQIMNFSEHMNLSRKAEWSKQQLLPIYEVTTVTNDKGFLQLKNLALVTPAQEDKWPEPEFTASGFAKISERLDWQRKVQAAIQAGKTSIE